MHSARCCVDENKVPYLARATRTGPPWPHVATTPIGPRATGVGSPVRWPAAVTPWCPHGDEVAFSLGFCRISLVNVMLYYAT